MDRPQRFPTFVESMAGAAVALLVAFVLFMLGTPAAIAPLTCAAVLLAYGALKGLGWLLAKVFGT